MGCDADGSLEPKVVQIFGVTEEGRKAGCILGDKEVSPRNRFGLLLDLTYPLSFLTRSGPWGGCLHPGPSGVFPASCGEWVLRESSDLLGLAFPALRKGLSRGVLCRRGREWGGAEKRPTKAHVSKSSIRPFGGLGRPAGVSWHFWF